MQFKEFLKMDQHRNCPGCHQALQLEDEVMLDEKYRVWHVRCLEQS